jgi:hypothetical protein
VTDDEIATHEMFQNDVAQDYVKHEQQVERLTHAGQAA